MTDIKELIRIDFDNMENHISDAITETSLGVFIESDTLRAYGIASEWLKKYGPVNIYLGHDGGVYPQFILKDLQVLNEEKEGIK